MFNGMMDSEFIRIAQEQMSRMSPDELAKIQQQMMSNPELLKMASESMKNLRPEDLKHAAEQLKHVRPEDMAEIGEKMANATPEELAAMRARADAQIAYELSAAEILKKQGNELHGRGEYNDASQKYMLAKKNLKGITTAKGKTLLLACSLNLMSCYLKTRQYDKCIKEGSEVLAYDSKNAKALYRRGQAYKELGQLEGAVTDLIKAHEASPDDDTIAEVLRDAKERLMKEGGTRTCTSTGLVIEEITEEVETVSNEYDNKSTLECSVTELPESNGSSTVHDGTVMERLTTNSESLQALKDDPNTIRSFQSFISNTDPETLATAGAGRVGEVPSDMLKTASNVISRMSPEELQNMIKLASSFHGENPLLDGARLDANFGRGSVPPNMTPEMMKAASDMMSKMSPDELQKMFEMASSLNQRDSASAATTSTSSWASSSDSRLKVSEAENNLQADRHGSSTSSYMNSISSTPSSFPTSAADMQEQMRNHMKDPAMRQMFTSMMKNMSPDMMASMGEQFGVKLSREDAAKAQQAMASVSPEDLDRMMRWADRIQRGVEGVKKTKNWLLGRPERTTSIGILRAIFVLRPIFSLIPPTRSIGFDQLPFGLRAFFLSPCCRFLVVSDKKRNGSSTIRSCHFQRALLDPNRLILNVQNSQNRHGNAVIFLSLAFVRSREFETSVSVADEWIRHRIVLMTGRIVIQSTPVVQRRQRLLSSKSSPSPPREKANVAEVAGGAAAECAAICCCCPCAMMNCLILAAYKVPMVILRRMWKKQRLKRLLKKKALLHPQTTGPICCSDELPEADGLKEFEMIKVSVNGSTEAIDLDKEMWERFHNTGFWRSPSQRHVV
ncbi:hypothetical protein Nepgr_012989 [Nepenthes gracilis]|uniref:Outer envelope protein 61 n=1 Tax=Nepenthes gracilis TaxID=150966 RepID=A0AAD3SH33_NEPGR|nr:hypothetical protein Nepgr_012989 [Nepenthes gracilis]